MKYQLHGKLRSDVLVGWVCILIILGLAFWLYSINFENMVCGSIR